MKMERYNINLQKSLSNNIFRKQRIDKHLQIPDLSNDSSTRNSHMLQYRVYTKYNIQFTVSCLVITADNQESSSARYYDRLHHNAH